MILVDTSAWVEFLRDTGSPACIRVGELLGADLATCDAIRMELLAGARNERHRRDLGRLIARAALISMQPGDFDQAAALYRQCRGRGETVRVLMDCLIGALAIRADLPVLHCDADFDALARHTLLRVDTT
jgi:predicted nucleic acid-binding protein